MKKLCASRSSLRAATVIACVLAVIGIACVVVAIRAQRSAPQPSSSAAGQLIEPSVRPSAIPVPRTSPRSTSGPGVPSSTAKEGMPASRPVALTIAKIGVSSLLTTLDRNADGTLQVPDSFHIAGWYDRSVTPGQVGPAVIVGHVDSVSGPGIFYRLGSLKPGDLVVVKRLDGTTVKFKITGVREYAKDQFPTIDVYGNTPIPTIRLITCGGTFDSVTHHYLSNIVAYGQIS